MSAEEEIRTPMSLRTQRPQRCASTNFATSAQGLQRCIISLNFQMLILFSEETKFIYLRSMNLQVELNRLETFFKTTPILIKEYKNSFMTVADIPKFINSQLVAAKGFSEKKDFNPPLARLQELEQAIINQIK